MSEIKAIETEYDGVLYRSRLEALWAAQLDALGIEHVYEPQGYEMNGIKYLPDFYLPKLDMFAEVKGVPDIKSALKIERLLEETGKDVVLLLGNGKMQFFSAKFSGYSINDNFGNGECEYNRREFNSRIYHDKGRYVPKSQERETNEQAIPYDSVPYEDVPYEPIPYEEKAQVQEQEQETPIIECSDDVASALSNPAVLQRVFAAVYQSLKDKKQAYGVLLMNTKATFDESDKTVHIKFPTEAQFAFNACQKPEMQKAISESIKSVVGTEIPFTLDKD